MWPKFFAALAVGGRHDLPTDLLGEALVQNGLPGRLVPFATSSVPAFIVVFIVGAVVAVLVLLNLCFRHCAQGCCFACVGWYMCFLGEEIQQKIVRRHARRPSTMPMIIASALMILLCGFSFWRREAVYQELICFVDSAFERLGEDVSVLKSNGRLLDNTAGEMVDNLVAVTTKCSSNALLTKFTGMGAESLSEYAAEISRYYKVIKPLPWQMKRAHEWVAQTNYLHDVYVFFPCMPGLVMAVVGLIIVMEALASKCFNAGNVAECLSRWMMVKAIIYAAMVLTMAAFAGFGVAAMVVWSQFCVGIDDNILDILHDVDIWNMTNMTNTSQADLEETIRYYIKGDVYNPLLGYVDTAQSYANQIVHIYDQFKGLVDATAISCPVLKEIDVSDLALKASHLLGASRKLLSAETIWPYYKEGVHDLACNHNLKDGGWFAVITILESFILFPICCISTHNFLTQWAKWKKAQSNEEDSDDFEEHLSDEEEEEYEEEGSEEDPAAKS